MKKIKQKIRCYQSNIELKGKVSLILKAFARTGEEIIFLLN